MYKYTLAAILAAIVGAGCGVSPFDPNVSRLNQAARTSLEETRRLVEKEGLRPTTKANGYRCDALFAAVDGGRDDIVEYLLEKGADPDAGEEESALHYAAHLGQAKCVSAILKSGYKVIENPRSHRSALSDAKGIECVKLLVEAGADLKHQDNWSNGVLSSAIHEGDIASLKYLLSKGAPIEDARGYMVGAVFREDVELLKVLKDHGGNVNEIFTLPKVPPGSWSPIHAAVPFPKSLEWILENGARVDQTNGEGDSALHIACDIAMTESVTLLLKHGASVSATDSEGRTPLHVLCFGTGSRDWKKEDRDHIDRIVSIVDLLVKEGADLDAKDKNGWTPLFRAATMGRRDVVRKLLALGADPKIKDHKGRIAADLARQLEQPEIAGILERL